MASTLNHPLRELTEAEILLAREVIIDHVGSSDLIFFRSIYLYEPHKAELLPFLQAEHDGTLSDTTPRPPRLAFVEYDTVKSGQVDYTRATVDVVKNELISNEVVKPAGQPAFTVYANMSATIASC